MGILAYQPFKGLYSCAAICFELARIPLWLVKYLTSYGRQHPEWTFRQALCVRLAYSGLYHVANIQLKTPLSLAPGKEKERFAVIKAAPADYYKGPLVSDENVKPVDIGATWYPAPLSASSDFSNVTVVLHIHGGAYVTADGRTAASGYFISKFLKHTPATHVICPQYRLSTCPPSKTSNPFPAALQDSLTTYIYLLKELKIPASSIIISGDSAGGNNAIAFLKYVAEYGADAGIANPSAAWLWSPWIQPGDDTDWTRTNPNFATDYLSLSFTWWGYTAYGGLKGREVLDSPWVSFEGKPFKSEVPMFVNTGSAEALYFYDRDWANMMKEAGNDVTLDVEKNVPHDVLLVGAPLGFDKEATACAKRAGEWTKNLRK